MKYTRKNVWELGGDWAGPVLWYARGVRAMQARTIAKPTSWNFYAAIHGFVESLWQLHGYWKPSDPKPDSKDTDRFWLQCQHGSWYFLPWHRGYILAFETNIRAEVVKLNGPADWALPYWNYFKPNQSKLPPAFASADWPDGKGDNPLFTQQRYGPKNDGNVYVPVDDPKVVNLKPMGETEFTGIPLGSRGFGGVDTGFEHGGKYHGDFEKQPHDMVHGLVGGNDSKNTNFLGLMSDPRTAGLDPIFWLHHANIDRLWQVWRQNPRTNSDPSATKWLRGPGSLGERSFSMPMPDGTNWDYTPGDFEDFTKLSYDYDDLSPVAAPVQPGQRLLRLGASTATVGAMEGAAVSNGTKVELIGANEAPMKVEGAEAATSVRLDPRMRSKVIASLAMDVAAPAPDRVFLNLENVRGLSDSSVLKIYVGLPAGAVPADHPERLAGSVSLFGVAKASIVDGEHAGQGVTLDLEITDIVDTLHLSGALNAGPLDVRIVPLNPIPETAKITIGRVSIFRQGR